MTTLASSVNIASHLETMAELQPTTDAVLANPLRNREGMLTYTHCNYRALNDRSNAIARGLASRGVTPGGRVALCLRPGIDFFAVTFGLFKLGAIPVLIDPGIGLRNFGRCLAQAEPSVFIGMPVVHLVRRALGWARQTVQLNVTTGSFGGTPLRLLEAAGVHACATPFPSASADDPAAILFTSGSTGPAKGVLYTHGNFDAQVHALRAAYDIQPGEKDLATFPLFGLFGPALGMTTIIPDMDFTRPGFIDPLKIIEPIQQLGITNMFGSPALIDRVSAYGATHQVKLPSLRRVISAGAPVPASVLARFSAMLSGDAQLFTPYGATESLPVASIGSNEILGETKLLTVQGKGVCVGRPVGGMHIRIIRITDAPIPEWADDLELPPGQIGEIAVQGPVVTREYFHRPDATRLAKISTQDPALFYHRMGDVGYLDQQGRLWFCGRKSQRVRTPGGDLFSAPFEEVFNTHPAVYRSALVGIPTDDSVRPVICIELKKETAATINLRTLTQEFLTLADQYPHTRIIRDFLIHPGFPVDIRHNAKINREQLTLWAKRKLS